MALLIQPPIQGLWIGDRLSKLERLSIRSFLKHGHEYHLYTYQKCEGVPDGAILRDANEILPHSFFAQDGFEGKKALASDYFRFKLLLDRGGWWVDLDVVCLKPLTFREDYVFASERSPEGPSTSSCVIKSPAGASYLHDAWERLHVLDRRAIQWGDAGPRLLAACIEGRMLREWVQGREVFCPIDPPDWESALRAKPTPRFGDGTFAIHLWHELWRRFGRDKDALYPRTCLYERLKREHDLAEEPRPADRLMQRVRAMLRPNVETE